MFHNHCTEQQLANEFQLLDPSAISTGVSLTSDNYSITDVSPLEINSNDIVTVFFRSTDPYYSDWIGAYSPPDANISTTAPVKYAYCNANSSYMLSGSGSLTFNFTNLRSGIKFYYFKGGVYHPVQVDQYDEVVTFRNPNDPLKPRIVASTSGDSNSFQLLWSSNDSVIPQLKW